MQNENIQISKYSSARDNKGTEYDLYSALLFIQSGEIADTILKLRNETDQKKRDNIKKSLPAVTFSGLFSSRKIENLISYSHVICLDIDKLEDVAATKELICKIDFVHSCFISPSGNGLKVLVKTTTPYIEHKELFISLEIYLNKNHNIEIDKSGKDICRLCFLSHDENIYINENSKTINGIFVINNLNENIAARPANKITPPLPIPTSQKKIDNLLNEVVTFTNNKCTYVDGERNNYVYQFACNANRKGIDFADTLDFCIYNFTDLDLMEIKASVKSAYEHHTHETGKFSTANNTKQAPEKKAPKTALKQAAAPTDGTNTDVLFWYDEIVTDAKGKEKKTVKFSYDNGIKFLENNGFFKIPMENNNYQFIRVQNNIIEIVKERNIREFMLEFLKTDDFEFKAVREMFRRGAKQYGATYYLEGLRFFYPDFKTDTETTAFIYFKNCYLEITADKIEPRTYAQLSGNIWSKQIIDFEIDFKDYSGCVYDRFLQLAILSKEKKEDIKFTEEDELKMNSVKSTIGYLLHQYKDSANPKAVIGVDQKLRDGKEDNGGTGKSMFAKALSKLIYTCTLDGKNFKFDAPYPFEKLNLDHSLINFNDVQKNFDFERLYGLLTEEFTYSKKYIDAITIPFETSPKFYISTNKTIKGSGNSVTRRQHIIEFSSYFNADRTPQKHFNQMFFYHWEKDEYTQFYLFMLDCLKYYLANGLQPFPLENYGLNKLIDTAGEEFIDYCNEKILENIHHTKEHEVKILFAGYLEVVKDTYRAKMLQNTFSKYIRQWCDLQNIEVNKLQDGGRHRSNGKDYFTFTTTEEEDIF